jgi:hypothetical protein
LTFTFNATFANIGTVFSNQPRMVRIVFTARYKAGSAAKSWIGMPGDLVAVTLSKRPCGLTASEDHAFG